MFLTLLTLSVAVLIGAGPETSWACATCWGANDALTRGLNASILFMMLMPFLIGGSVLGILYIAHQRTRGQRSDVWMSKQDVRLQPDNGRRMNGE